MRCPLAHWWQFGKYGWHDYIQQPGSEGAVYRGVCKCGAVYEYVWRTDTVVRGRWAMPGGTYHGF